MAQLSKKPRRPSVDLEEIAPNRFLMHNPRAHAVIKSEGTVTGRMFELTTWRREGLIARLRDRGFSVRTLDDQLGALPEPPPPPAISRPGWRPLASAIEQISHFDLRQLRWHPLTPELRDGVAGVTIYDGWVLRRRKGRSAASYYLAFLERSGGIALRSLTESKAILSGYAQALEFDDRPLLAERRGDKLLLPDVELPPAYRELLASFSETSAEGPLVDQGNWPLAQELFGRLRVRLTLADADKVKG